MKRIKDYFLNPRPSLFDLCIAGFLFIPWLKDPWQRCIFLVFYTLFLVLISLSMKPKREYRSIPLSLLALWSLAGMFIHSFIILPHSRIFSYLNYYLAVEGFLYILIAVLFIHTIVKYSTNIRFILLLLPLSILPWYKVLAWKGSVTPVAALGVGIVTYLFLARRPLWATLGLITGILGAVWQWSWITMKFASRPLVWYQLIVNNFYHPVRKAFGKGDVIDPGITLSPFVEKFCNGIWPNFADKVKPWFAGFVGAGFSDYLDPEYTWVDKDIFGWSYKQNDYLVLSEALGPIVLVFIAWFIIDSLKKIGIQPALILFLALIISCFFQLTMWFPDKAGIYLLIGSLCITEGLRKKEEI